MIRVLCENHSVHIGQPFFRGFRALVFAVVCVAVSAGLHCVAGGSVVGPGRFASAVAVIAVLALLVGGAQRGSMFLLVACALAQSGLHVWFSLGEGHAEHLTPSPSMLLVHSLAAVVSALWLERGESAMAAFIDFLVLLCSPGLWLRLLKPFGPALPPRPMPAAPVFVRIWLDALTATASRRGPPVHSFSL